MRSLPIDNLTAISAITSYTIALLFFAFKTRAENDITDQTKLFSVKKIWLFWTYNKPINPS